MAAVAAHLRPLGFSGSGKVFSRSGTCGNLEVIHFQFLSRTDIAEVRPSIGITSLRLAKALGPDATRVSREIHSGVFVRHIAEDMFTFPVRGDESTFILRSNSEADDAAGQMIRFLENKGFAWLAENCTDEAIVRALMGARGMNGEWAIILDDVLNGRLPGSSLPIDPLEKFIVRK